MTREEKGPPPLGQKQNDPIPVEPSAKIQEEIVRDQQINSCFYCGRLDNGKIETRNEVVAYLHNELDKTPTEEKKQLNVGELTEEQAAKFHGLMEQYQDLLAWTSEDLGRTNLVYHSIDTGNAKPVRQRWYRTSRAEQQFISEEIRRMLKQGLIEKSRSEWTSPVVLVRKKNGKLRFCVDYRQLNQLTKKDLYPLPRIDDMLDALGNVSWYTSLDLASGYWQVEVRPEDRDKTTFITQYGTYRFIVMPFGLCNAPATFQRLMNEVLEGILWDFVVVYLDDLNVYSATFDQHLEHLRAVFERLRSAGLKLNPEKCYFAKHELAFLGYLISAEGIHTDPAKIEKVKEFPVPRNVTQLRGFLGLASYYRRFIKDFSKIANPLNKLLRKDAPFVWAAAQQQSFDLLKTHLTQAPILAYPKFDQEFLLLTDASTLGLGAILAQKDEEEMERVVAYASRTLNKAEKNYSATELECLAVVWAIGHFHPYVHGKRFTLITDHSALRYLFNSATPTGRLARWVMKLQPYDFKIIHRAGKKHTNVDSLSRAH
jgi:hypothetical protein